MHIRTSQALTKLYPYNYIHTYSHTIHTLTAFPYKHIHEFHILYAQVKTDTLYP